MKKSKITLVPTKQLAINEGQLEWLPRNPRTWTKTDIDRMVASIEKDPDFAEDRPVLAVPGDGGTFVVFAHNLLTKASKEKGVNRLPTVVYEPENEEDKETIRRRAILDNGSLGEWDPDILANEWEYTPEELQDLGIADWVTGADGSTPGDQQGGEPAAGSGAKQTHEDDFDEAKDGILVRCKPGDIWQLGDHRLMCGDSTDLETVKTLMGGYDKS